MASKAMYAAYDIGQMVSTTVASIAGAPSWMVGMNNFLFSGSKGDWNNYWALAPVALSGLEYIASEWEVFTFSAPGGPESFLRRLTRTNLDDGWRRKAWGFFSNSAGTNSLNALGNLFNTGFSLRNVNFLTIKNNPLHENIDQAVSLEFFCDNFNNCTYNEIKQYINKKSNPSGNRYVINPHDGYVIDMRHMLYVGYQHGEIMGAIIEIGQWVAFRPSGRNKQDYYSNWLGFQFAKSFENSINISPNKLTFYLSKFFDKPTPHNHIPSY